MNKFTLAINKGTFNDPIDGPRVPCRFPKSHNTRIQFNFHLHTFCIPLCSAPPSNRNVEIP